MIRTPWSENHWPNQPWIPYTSVSASPMTTGETRNGRSISASSTVAARPRRRTSTSAQPTPKIVFSGTAIAAISSDSHSALIAAGVVIQSQATVQPCWKVLKNTTPTGSSSRSSR